MRTVKNERRAHVTAPYLVDALTQRRVSSHPLGVAERHRADTLSLAFCVRPPRLGTMMSLMGVMISFIRYDCMSAMNLPQSHAQSLKCVDW